MSGLKGRDAAARSSCRRCHHISTGFGAHIALAATKATAKFEVKYSARLPMHMPSTKMRTLRKARGVVAIVGARRSTRIMSDAKNMCQPKRDADIGCADAEALDAARTVSRD